MSNYRTQDGMRVSMTGEVLGLTPQGERPCFNGKLETLTFLFAD